MSKIRMERAAARRYSGAMDTLIEKARDYLDRHRGERVTLGRLAQAVGASPFHLQRRFKDALGVSPRDYQDAHRVESLKSELKNGSRVTDAVFAAGYGSVSRFYEKAAARLGMAARAYRAKGRGERIAWTTFASPLGRLLVAATARGVCALKLGDDEARLERLLAEEFPQAELARDAAALAGARAAILDFLAGDASIRRVPLDLRGTVFQRRVWDALARIPRGETRSYGELAAAVGHPKAVRAVGSACGANPVALLVPCHRAVRSDGSLGGYAWGLDRKRKLLAMEARPAKRGR